jgi:hypothetical protein
MIVCLDKARPFSEVPDGRSIIGKLTHIRIRTSNMKNKRNINILVFSEREIAVPVSIFTRDASTTLERHDWTRSASLITENSYAPLQRWWPRSIFRRSQKIGDIAEEICLEYPNFTLKLSVEYAFTSNLKKLFDDIDEGGGEGKADNNSVKNASLDIEKKDSDARQNETMNENKKIEYEILGAVDDGQSNTAKEKNNSKITFNIKNIIIGSIGFAAMVAGIIYFVAKTSKNKN